MNNEEKIITKAISMCFKPFLKPEEAYIYTNLERSRFAEKCQEFGIFKTSAGYYSREELDKMMAGAPSNILQKARNLRL
jgi:hypothetical protein